MIQLLLLFSLSLVIVASSEYPECVESGFEMLRLADTNTQESSPNSKFSWVPKLNKDALDKIKNMTSSISIIGIVGRARTGKSFFLHTIVRKGIFGCVPKLKKTFFSVGSTTESHTKGILLLMYTHNNRTLGLIDTEGLSDNYDKKIDEAITYFAFLISSTLVINVEKTITTHDVSYLQEALLHRKMMAQNKIQIPNLFWMIQFYTLKIPSSLTPTEYLLSKINQSNGLIKEGIHY
jgi:hypothetical protein